jgi:bifunctional UDP-N-acetylglucosamine pyrophosphorylase/glucosamine-1-phosphate N-acetyltransferase
MKLAEFFAVEPTPEPRFLPFFSEYSTRRTMEETVALILAAGKGTRMHSNLAKVLHPICGKPMLSYPLAALRELGCNRILAVIGHQAERIQQVFAPMQVEWVVQSQQLGTAHAVLCALPRLTGFTGTVLICCGDTPLLTADTLKTFLGRHHETGVDLSVLTMVLEEPGSYGRILRDSQGRVEGIVEAKDARVEQHGIPEVNTGIYSARADLLHAVIPSIGNANVQKEYYLTDLVHKAAEQGWKVETVVAADPQEFLGVNTRDELAQAAAIISLRMEKSSPEKA